MGERTITSAVLIERVPVYRLGLAAVLRRAGLFVAAETSHVNEAVKVAADQGVHLAVIGEQFDASPIDVVLKLRQHRPDVVVLAMCGAEPPTLPGQLSSIDVEAILGRLADPEAVADAVERLRGGERVVAPELISMITGPGGFDRGPERPAILTPKEMDVLTVLASGKTNREIANELSLNPETVKTHLRHIYGKLGVRSRRQALDRSVALNLLG
jgi:DNA-binding NarL/FixJ family response regulator